MQIQYCTWCVKKHVDIFLKNILSYIHSGISVEFVVLSAVVCTYSYTIKNCILKPCGLENRDYGRRGSAALSMRHPSIRKS
jgi:hypothetical protein